jgi:hypothetical protein
MNHNKHSLRSTYLAFPFRVCSANWQVCPVYPIALQGFRVTPNSGHEVNSVTNVEIFAYCTSSPIIMPHKIDCNPIIIIQYHIARDEKVKS